MSPYLTDAERAEPEAPASTAVPNAKRFWQFGIIVAVLLATMATPAMAEAPANANQAEIDRLYDEGKAALATDAPLALRLFKSALHLAEGQSEQTWRLFLAIGLAYNDSDAPTHAMEYFRRFLAHTDAHQDQLSLKWKQRRDRVMAALTDLEAALKETHGFLSVTSIPAGAKLKVNGAPAGADRNAVTPFEVILTPGDHMLELTYDGYAPVQRVVTVTAGAAQSIPIAMKATKPIATEANEAPKAASTGKSVADEVTPSTTPSPSTSSNALPWVTMGIGGGLGLAGAIFTLLASGESAELDAIRAVGGDPGQAQGQAYAAQWQEHADAVDTYQIVAGVLYGLAAATVATGVVLLVLEPSDTRQTSTLLPSFNVAPTSGGLSGRATWRF